ncbi:hypothetical protein [Acidicapsa acidisoli]|uniref:hypothetical protein n=1 Tax=Acidicapsa acidisoli TaxID=1615681 RepID=UPI0021DF6E4B|nr:hypothetical protein [Acidicapsa acidisoli]
MPIDPTMTSELGSDRSKRGAPIEVSSFGWYAEDPMDDSVLGLDDEDELEGPREPEDE